VGLVGAGCLTLWAALGIGFDPGQLLEDLSRGSGILSEVLRPDLAFLPDTIGPLIETFQIAVIAAIVGCAVALPAAFLASRVTAPNGWVLAVDRGTLNVIRALPDLLYAMVFVAALSVGPAAGILALVFFNLGVMAKLLSETVDAVDQGPLEAARAAAATHWLMVRSAVFPQVLPSYVAYALYVFELNVRSSTVIGIVGAGGIGNLLNQQMKYFAYGNVGLILAELFVLVLVIELASMSLRRRLL
jgi:phosphonate transport system permease protein